MATTILLSQLTLAQLSKTHYIPPLTSSAFGNANPESQYIYISTPSAVDVPFTVKPVGLPTTSHITGLVSNANPEVIFIGSGNGQLFVPSIQTSTVMNKGYVIEAEDLIYASVRMEAGGRAQAGALVSKGTSALGTEFRVGTYTNENPQDNYLNFVSVMATEDNTQVVFDNLPSGLIIKNYTGTTPVSITLNENESYVLATNSFDTPVNKNGLIGCLVSATKNIVVNCGSANGSFHNGDSRDYGLDQIVGADKIGNEYIFVKGDGENGWENVLLVAHSDNTSISINGNAPVTTINAGDYYLIEGNNYNAAGNMYVETSEAVFAYQGVGATNEEANQGMFFVPPLSCEAVGNLDNIADIARIGNTTYSGGVSIVTTVGSTVTINNQPIANFNPVGPNLVTGNANYVTYKVTGLSGNVSVQSTDELYCAYFNFNGFATSGSFYSGFPSAPEINFDATFDTLGNCIPNITLAAANTQNFDTFEWFFDDGSGTGFIGLGISTPNLTPTLPGTYKLAGVVNCSGLVLESTEVPISICPDDIDNDGIIDNIDIDNDNDGILNCEESNGDVSVNLVNLIQPQFTFQDGSTSTTLATGATNTGIAGDILGNFTSIVDPTNAPNNEYRLSFAEPIHFIVSEGSSVPYAMADLEYIVVKITPNNKNITLIDPSDKLLVDSNFDGIFESGVTLISGSEIRFRINPNPLGNTPFRFSAVGIDEFIFTHHSPNTPTSETSPFNITLGCYKRDTDLDGVEDALDLDSDNDGIPDRIEYLGNDSPNLSGIDTDNNGLDDVYDGVTPPIDTDADGILDYLDLDSDNDGIYDLLETGQQGLLSDTDENGMADLNVGANGWVDTAETTPDSGIISYVLDDLDNDSNYSYLDLDSDGDLCSDVIEAGFSDNNADNFLGNTAVQVNSFGVVINATDGYTAPHPDYLTAAPIVITTQPENTTVCEFSNTSLSLVSNDAETFQWEVSTDDGVTWNSITDDAIYGGTSTNTLTIATVPLGFHENRYRTFTNRNGNSCGLYSEEALLTVNPLPVVNSSVSLVQCDDDNDGFTLFNLNEANTKISGNAANETFTYYLTETAALVGDENSTDYITDPLAFMNQNVSTGTVWARVASEFNCVAVSEIQLQVSTTAIPASFQSTFNVCDDLLDINGDNTVGNDNRDGISSFDFSSVTAEILAFIPAGQNPLPPRYFRNLEDALTEENEITNITNYRNIGYPNTQEIYVRVDSDLSNDCLGLGAHITLNVEALPVANPVTIPRQCDDDQDGLFLFDTSALEATVLGTQTLTDVSVAYFDENNNPLPSPFPDQFLTASQTLTVRVTNNITADPNGACYDETTVAFIVDTMPIAHTVNIPEQCDDDENDTDGFYGFDSSYIENTLLQGQTGMEVHYFDGAGQELPSPLPNPFVSNTQTVTAIVVNPINPNCFDSTTLDFVVNPLPAFTLATSEIVCTSDPTFTITLDPSEADASENFEYKWAYENGDILSTESTLTVSTPGTYMVTLAKTDGTGCERSRSVFVDASELATITLEDITVKDISDNNTITIATENNNLGLGDYEFALDNEFGLYQDEPFFDGVLPGIYMLYVRDKRGCGTASIEIAVVGYPKFFTPNDDGFNDTWQILGISPDFQSQTTIYIFNRYGKLLEELSPMEVGWDGTFNGSDLPSSDYWFKVMLEDGRIFNGHFTLKR